MKFTVWIVNLSFKHQGLCTEILHDQFLFVSDIDECQEGTHTCHPSARCINNEGGFQCTCPRDRGPDCKLSK